MNQIIAVITTDSYNHDISPMSTPFGVDNDISSHKIMTLNKSSAYPHPNGKQHYSNVGVGLATQTSLVAGTKRVHFPGVTSLPYGVNSKSINHYQMIPTTIDEIKARILSADFGMLSIEERSAMVLQLQKLQHVKRMAPKKSGDKPLGKSPRITKVEKEVIRVRIIDTLQDQEKVRQLTISNVENIAVAPLCDRVIDKKRMKRTTAIVDIHHILASSWSMYAGTTESSRLPDKTLVDGLLLSGKRMRAQLPKLDQLELNFTGYKQRAKRMQTINLYSMLTHGESVENTRLWMASILYACAKVSPTQLRSVVVNNIMYALIKGKVHNRSLVGGMVDSVGSCELYDCSHILACLSLIPDILLGMRKSHRQIEKRGGTRSRARKLAVESVSKSAKARQSRCKTSSCLKYNIFKAYPINESSYAKLYLAFCGIETMSGAIRSKRQRLGPKYARLWDSGIGEEVERAPVPRPPIAESQGWTQLVGNITSKLVSPVFTTVTRDVCETGLTVIDRWSDTRLARGASIVRQTITAPVRNISDMMNGIDITGTGIIAADRLTDLTTDFGLAVGAAYLSDKPSVRILCTIIAIRKVFAYFGLGTELISFFMSLATRLGQEGRAWIDELQGVFALPIDAEITEPIAESQSLPTMSFTLKKFVMEKGLQEGYNFVKALVISKHAMVAWNDQIAAVSAADEEMGVMLRGLKLITEQGGSVWVGSNSNNALIAAYVSRLAERMWAKYNMIPGPIPTRSLKACYDMARGYASTISAVNGGVRQAATLVYIYGAPGQGKTTATTMLRSSINRELSVVPLSQSYSPTLNEEFHDGYVGQPIVMINDAFHMTDKTLRYQSANMLMTAADTTPYPLKMSSVGAKGNVFFSSAVVLASSNMALHETAMSEIGLSDSTALHRRIDFYVEQRCIKKEIMVTCGNNQVISPSLIMAPLSAEIYEYTLRNVTNGDEIATLTHAELVARIMATIERKALQFNEARGLSTTDEQSIADMIRLYAEAGVIAFEDDASESTRNTRFYEMIKLPDISSWLDWDRKTTFVAASAVLAVLGALIMGYKLWQKTTTMDVEAESRDEQYVRAQKRVPVRISQRSANRQQYRQEQLEVELQSYIETKFCPTIADEVGLPEIVFPPIGETLTAELTGAYVAQGCDDANALTVAGGRVINQLYWMEYHSEAGYMVSCQAFNFSEKYFIVPLHTWLHAKQSPGIIKLFGVDSFTWKSDWVTEDKLMPECDIAIIQADADCFHDGTCLISKFVDKDQLSLVQGSCLLACRLGNASATAGFFGSAMLSPVSSSNVAAVNKDIQGFNVTSLYKYPMMQTFKGMCASPVMILDSTVSGKIIGFHCAGDKLRHGGYCAPIYREMFAQYEPKRTVVRPPYEVPSKIAVAQGLDVIGAVPHKFYQRQNEYSSIIPMFCNGEMVESHTKPAKLKPDYFSHPLHDAVFKRAVKTGAPWKSDVDMAVRVVVAHYKNLFWMHGIETPRLLTFDEAVFGNGEPFIDPIVLKTSPGFPWNVYKPGSKASWIKVGDHSRYTIDNRLTDAVHEFYTAAYAGGKPPVYFRDSLKDEKRCIKKVDDGRTRLFCGAPIDFIILFRMYYQSAIAKICSLAEWGPVSVGLDPHGRGWTCLAKQFERIPGDNFMAGDFAAYDCHVPACFVSGALRILRNLTNMPDDEYLVCNALEGSVVFANHVVEGLIYRVCAGIPSGVPGTSVINSLANLLMHMCYWKYLKYPLDQYFDKTDNRFYGDDSLVKVSIEYPLMNMIGFRDWVQSTCIMIYTDNDKEGVERPYKRQHEIVFLQRKFVFMENLNVYCAPLPMYTLLDMFSWTRTDGIFNQYMTAVKSAHSFGTEASHYSEADYDGLTKKLSAVLFNHSLAWCPPIYREQIARYL